MNSDLKKPRHNIIVILVSIVMFMEFLDTTIINTAVPSIAKSFQQDPLLLKFSVTSYFLSLAIFTPMSGWCADKIGTKKIFLGSVFLFVLASLLCGLSKNIFELTFFRFFQGMGGAFMNPVSRIIILRIFPPKDLVRVQGFIFTPAMLGFVLGPTLGGIMTTYLSWSWIFFINIPVGLVVFYFAFFNIPQQKDLNVKKFDLLGFILSAVSLGCISFAVDMIGHIELVSQSKVVFIGVLGFILFLVLIYHCLHKENSLFDFLLCKIKTFRIGFFANLCTYSTTAGVAFLLPLMYQEQFLYSPVHSGFLVLPVAVAQLVARFLAPRLIHKLGFKYSMMFGSLSLILSIILIQTFNHQTSLGFIVFSEFLYGASVIIYASATGALNYIDIPKDFMGKATALDMTSRQFAASIGVAICALSLNSFRNFYGLTFASEGGLKIFHNTFLIIACLGFCAFLYSLRLSRQEGQHALR